MANRERGELKLDLGSRTLTLKLTVNAVCEAEQATGRPFPAILMQISRGSISDMRAFLWAAAREHHPDLTIAQVGDLIEQGGGLNGLAEKLNELVELNAKEGTPRPTPAAKRRSRGTGAAST